MSWFTELCVVGQWFWLTELASLPAAHVPACRWLSWLTELDSLPANAANGSLMRNGAVAALSCDASMSLHQALDATVISQQSRTIRLKRWCVVCCTPPSSTLEKAVQGTWGRCGTCSVRPSPRSVTGPTHSPARPTQTRWEVAGTTCVCTASLCRLTWCHVVVAEVAGRCWWFQGCGTVL